MKNVIFIIACLVIALLICVAFSGQDVEANDIARADIYADDRQVDFIFYDESGNHGNSITESIDDPSTEVDETAEIRMDFDLEMMSFSAKVTIADSVEDVDAAVEYWISNFYEVDPEWTIEQVTIVVPD